jgi:hypothetical protein
MDWELHQRRHTNQISIAPALDSVAGHLSSQWPTPVRSRLQQWRTTKVLALLMGRAHALVTGAAHCPQWLGGGSVFGKPCASWTGLSRF